MGKKFYQQKCNDSKSSFHDTQRFSTRVSKMNYRVKNRSCVEECNDVKVNNAKEIQGINQVMKNKQIDNRIWWALPLDWCCAHPIS